jgi:hypothetical protein
MAIPGADEPGSAAADGQPMPAVGKPKQRKPGKKQLQLLQQQQQQQQQGVPAAAVLPARAAPGLPVRFGGRITNARIR